MNRNERLRTYLTGRRGKGREERGENLEGEKRDGREVAGGENCKKKNTNKCSVFPRSCQFAAVSAERLSESRRALSVAQL